MKPIEAFAVEHLMSITPRPPLVFVRGEGAWLWDHDDKQYLDFVQGWAVNSLGHCPPAIVDALTRQANTLISPSPAYFNEASINLAETITSHSCFDQAFFASSGGEANEGAIKLARRWGAAKGKYRMITFDQSFHGRTLATMSASGKAAFEPLFEPKVPGFSKATLNDIDSVTKLINDETVAVMLEPIQGEGGVNLAEDSFLQDLRALTDERDLLLIVDEIQTGVGRTGQLWAYEHASIEPDIMTLGKGLGGGVPLAALLATQSVSCFKPGDQGGTYCGNPLMCAVGSAVMNQVLQPGFLMQVSSLGAHLKDQLLKLSARHGLGEVRGRGLLIALELGRDVAAQVVDRALEDGLLINAPKPATLRFMPPLNVTIAEIDLALTKLDVAIASALRDG